MNTRKQLDQNFKIFLQHFEITKKKYNQETTLIAISKTKPLADILEAYNIGQQDFGENYLIEAITKIQTINRLNRDHKKNIDITWHYIGAIQSNKTRQIAENFAWVHSVSSLKVIQRLNKQRPQHLDKLNILLQINIENDPSKGGLDTKSVTALCAQIKELKLEHVQLRGLMGILSKDTSNSSFEQQYQAFLKLKELQVSLSSQFGFKLDNLSMGMSNDYQAAIAAGSTMIRIGSALFGPREDLDKIHN